MINLKSILKFLSRYLIKKKKLESIPQSILSSGIVIEGNVTVNGDLFIYGHFNGEIHSNGTVMIGPEGVVSGKIYTYLLIVAGKLDGYIVCENCELLKNGQLRGMIFSRSLIIENNGFFEGSNNSLEDLNESNKEKIFDDDV